MQVIEYKLKSATNHVLSFIKWALIAGCTGLLGGGLGVLFHQSVEFATELRMAHGFIIWFLPIGGVAIIALHQVCKLSEKIGTNEVIDSIRTRNSIPPILAPLIFFSTVITHLFGGSAGREGAALQLGGSIGSMIGKLFKLDEKDMHIITLCGMSSVFAALFGTPITAAFFALEVISVGVIYYAGLIPCIVSSLMAYKISLFFGVKPIRFPNLVMPQASFAVIAQIGALAAICALVSILFCMLIKKTHHLFFKTIKNNYLRIIAGGALIILFTYLVKTSDYNGAGMDVIERAIGGNARPEAFLMKMILTAITIGAGYKGGEIVPTFFIGATLGCVLGNILGLGGGFGAALGMIALFCGVVNCPIASVFLSIEIFGAQGMILFAVACAVSYTLSGYYSLYSTQKIVYSKLKAEFINMNAK